MLHIEFLIDYALTQQQIYCNLFFHVSMATGNAAHSYSHGVFIDKYIQSRYSPIQRVFLYNTAWWVVKTSWLSASFVEDKITAKAAPIEAQHVLNILSHVPPWLSLVQYIMIKFGIESLKNNAIENSEIESKKLEFVPSKYVI